MISKLPGPSSEGGVKGCLGSVTYVVAESLHTHTEYEMTICRSVRENDVSSKILLMVR